MKTERIFSGLAMAAAVAAMLLTGCALNANFVDVQQDATPAAGNKDATASAGKGSANGSNIIVLSFADSPITTNKDQKSTGEIPIGYNGGTAAAGKSGLTDVASKYAPDFSKEDSDNTTTTTTTTTTNYKDNEDNVVKGEDVKEEVSQGKEETSEDLDYAKKKTYTSYGTRNGGRQAWRIPEKGPDFGNKVKVVFSDGKTFTVNDTSKNCRDREDTCNRDSSSPMYGFVFKPGIGQNGDGDDNTGTSHGGVYLHAPYGSTAKQVTFYFNK